VIIAEVVYATEWVVIANVPVLLPAATITEVVTVAEAELLAKDTDTPPAGAAPLKVTVPVEETPLATLVGLRETDEIATLAAGVIVSTAVLLALL
jgi:hypothetical protein